jgi:hypothetical protein
MFRAAARNREPVPRKSERVASSDEGKSLSLCIFGKHLIKIGAFFLSTSNLLPITQPSYF